MTAKFVDYAYGIPDWRELKAAGITGVCRYLSWDPHKDLTKTEADAAHAHGFAVVLNWEGTGDWAELGQGFAGGQRAGAQAAHLCAEIGAPQSIPIFVSSDFDAAPAQFPTIVEFLRGFAQASGHTVGIYGQGDLIDFCLTNRAAVFGWQTNATGWGGVSPHAVMIQSGGGEVAQVDVDFDDVPGDPAAFAWMPPSIGDDDMTPDQAAELAKALEQASQANLRAIGVQNQMTALTLALAPTIVADSYERRLGRAPSAAELEQWCARLATDTPTHVDAMIAATPEGVAYAKKLGGK